MMLIACPWCGPREETEFVCGGDAGVMRPSAPDRATDEEWAAYLFFRDNLRGSHRERWLHRFGCGQWFGVVRDTDTHEITAVFQFDSVPPKP